MRLNRLFHVIIVVSLLSPLFLVEVTTAEDTIESKVTANFDIEFNTATDFKITITMDVSKIKTAFGTTYDGIGIQNLASSTNYSDIEDMGAIKSILRQLLDKQISGSFEKANFTASIAKPYYESGLFKSEYIVNLTSSYFGLDEAVDAYNLVNGILDMGAIVNYSLNLKAESGWNNTYIFNLGPSLTFKRTTGTLSGNSILWVVKNWNGNNPGTTAELQLKKINPTTRLESEDIFLEFELNSKDVAATVLNSNVLLKSVDIRGYNILPSFVTNLDFVTSDGIRLFIDNGLTSWDDLYNKTINPVEKATISTIKNSSLNQTLNMVFSWYPETTTNCSNPYDITNMNEEPPIKAKVSNNDIKLKICDVSARALFGLIDAGAIANISANEINFGDKLNETGYPYNGSLYLPDNISLAGEKIYRWNQSKPISGEFKSDDAPEYSNEKIQTTIEIEFSGLDLNLFGLFTGKAELTSKLYTKETSNYYVTTLPDEFTLPDKVKLGYLNSDAFRLCVEENVFVEEKVNEFLANEKILFETRLISLLPGLKINGLVNRDAFDRSIASWDGEITNMDADTPVTTASDAHSSYPVTFSLSFSPPKFEITEQSLNLTGLQNQNVTYRIVLPRGTTMDASDSLNRLVPGKTADGRDYIEISFDASESDLTDIVSFKIVPSPLFALSIFLPCIVCLIIAVVLIIAILIIRKKRKGFGGKRSRPKKTKESKEDEEEESGGYEEQEYYVPPPPSSKKSKK